MTTRACVSWAAPTLASNGCVYFLKLVKTEQHTETVIYKAKTDSDVGSLEGSCLVGLENPPLAFASASPLTLALALASPRILALALASLLTLALALALIFRVIVSVVGPDGSLLLRYLALTLAFPLTLAQTLAGLAFAIRRPVALRARRFTFPVPSIRLRPLASRRRLAFPLAPLRGQRGAAFIPPAPDKQDHRSQRWDPQRVTAAPDYGHPTEGAEAPAGPAFPFEAPPAPPAA